MYQPYPLTRPRSLAELNFEMEVCFIAIIVCSLLRSAHAQGVSLSAELWAVVGLVVGVVIILVGLIWIIFCVMLYRHQREVERENGDEDYNEVKEKDKKKKKKKQKKRQEREEPKENREIELPIHSRETDYVQDPTSEDLWTLDDNIQQVIQPAQPPPSGTPPSGTPPPGTPPPGTPPPGTPPQGTQSRETPVQSTQLSSVPELEPQPVPATTSDPSDLRPSPSPIVTKPYTPVPEIFESIFTPPTNTSEEEDHRRGLHVKLSNVSSSRLRKISDVEECDVQPDVSNFPLRYGQRRISSTTRPISDYGSSDPFTFKFERPVLGRNQSQKRDMSSGVVMFEKSSREISNNKDLMFGQLSSWPEFD